MISTSSSKTILRRRCSSPRTRISNPPTEDGYPLSALVLWRAAQQSVRPILRQGRRDRFAAGQEFRPVGPVHGIDMRGPAVDVELENIRPVVVTGEIVAQLHQH